MDTEKLWDVAVIGGGAAGMMAAGTAAGHGASVVLIEKNDSLGKKLLITGGGRCNVTNAEIDTRALLTHYKDAAKFLASPFSRFSVPETLDFFHMRGMETKVEAERRVFPMSDRAQSVWNVLVEYLEAGHVTILSNSPAVGFTHEKGRITGVKLSNPKIPPRSNLAGIVRARSFILATGGLSHPETGSTGDGFEWLRAIGHTVHTSRPALVPVTARDTWIPRVSGVSLQHVKITVIQNGTKHESARGKILFTHRGLSGPGILNMSTLIGELLPYDNVTIELDLLPDVDDAALNTRLQEIFKMHHMKKIANSLTDLVPTALARILIEHASISADTPCNSVSRTERIALIKACKHLTIQVDGLQDTGKAIITAGGVDLREVDFKNCSSRLYPNLYLIGDILDINRPSGGYSLQLCWTTGSVAGIDAANNRII